MSVIALIFAFTVLIGYVETVFFKHKITLIIVAFNVRYLVFVILLVVFIRPRILLLHLHIISPLHFFAHFALFLITFLLFFEE
jgi:hypothetical protein